MPREILIIRHGEAYNTADPDGARVIADRANPPLTPQGEMQADRLAERLLESAPDTVLCSPFLRAAQTARPYLLTGAATAAFEPRMCEEFIFSSLKQFRGVDLVDYEGRFGRLLPATPELGERTTYPRYPESKRSLQRRVATLADEWIARDGWRRLALFGHGATVGAMIVQLDRTLLGTVPVPTHTSVTAFTETGDGRWEITRLNDTSHLEELPASGE